MGHPDLNIDVSQMKPLLESQQISSLHNESVSNYLFTFSHVLTPAGNTSYLFMYFSNKHQTSKVVRYITINAPCFK